jgi:hypothetical protein
MNSTITTITLLILALVTSFLFILMYLDRAKFIRTLKGQKGLFNLKASGPDELLTMIQIFFPDGLQNVTDEKLIKLRESAVKSTRYAIISFLVTLTFPIILFNSAPTDNIVIARSANFIFGLTKEKLKNRDNEKFCVRRQDF